MGGEAREERLGSLAAEKMCERRCGKKCNEAEAREQERMGCRHVERAEDFGGEDGPAVDEGLQQASPAPAVGSENRSTRWHRISACDGSVLPPAFGRARTIFASTETITKSAFRLPSMSRARYFGYSELRMSLRS